MGKTACLVHIATDQLLQRHYVIHLSYANRPDHIASWYSDIFGEIARKRNLENEQQVFEDAISRRVLMNFSHRDVDTAHVLNSAREMIDNGKFNADLLVVDGFDFKAHGPSDIQQFREFAHERKLTVWFSATLHRDDPQPDNRDAPHRLLSYIDMIDIVITLLPESNHITLRLVKDHANYPKQSLRLKIDPRTLLIAED